MKKILLIFVLFLLNINFTHAIIVETPIDMSAVFSFCTGTQCVVPEWTTWFEIVLSGIIKYIIFIASLAWVLFIVINWILYSMSWFDQSLKDSAKKRIIQTLLGLIVLLLSWIILHTIAPWVYS